MLALSSLRQRMFQCFYALGAWYTVHGEMKHRNEAPALLFTASLFTYRRHLSPKGRPEYTEKELHF